MNPQKLTGMCGKIKCCMNFEVNAYAEAQRSLPDREVVLETQSGSYYHFKTDHFQRQITYSTVRNAPVHLVTISAERAFEVIAQNKKGERPEQLEVTKEGHDSAHSRDILAGNSLTRFDNGRRGKRSGDRARRGEPRRRDTAPSERTEGRPQVRQFRSPRTRREETKAEATPTEEKQDGK